MMLPQKSILIRGLVVCGIRCISMQILNARGEIYIEAIAWGKVGNGVFGRGMVGK